MKTKCEKK